MEKFFHLIKLFPGSQHHISLLGGEGKIDTGLVVIVPGSVTVVEVKGNNHTVPLCLFLAALSAADDGLP